MKTSELIKKHVRIEQYLSRRGVELKPGGGKQMIRCPLPGHEDKNPSFSIGEAAGVSVFKCFGCGRSGSVIDLHMELENCSAQQAIERLALDYNLEYRAPNGAVERKIEAVYDYRDVDGELLFQVVRMRGKQFWQRKPDPDRKGEYIYNIKGVRKVPYRLPEVAAADKIYVVEGEKDAETVFKCGAVGTCNPGGAGCWKVEYNQYLKGKRVVIIPDQDEPGLAHARGVAGHLIKSAEEVKIVKLPDGVKDVTEFIEGGGSWAEIRQLEKHTRPMAAQPEEPEAEVMNFFSGKRFRPNWLAQHILHEQNYVNLVRKAGDAHGGMNLHVYRDGYYQATGYHDAVLAIMRHLGSEYNQNRVNETLQYIAHNCQMEPEYMNCNKRLINLKNGMLDWRRKKLLPHDPMYLSTYQVPVQWNPEAAMSDELVKFTTEVLPEDSFKTVREFMGYCLVPMTKYQKAMMLVGKGRNGKSTFLEFFEAMVGSNNVSKVPLNEIDEHRFKRAELEGKLVNIFADISTRALKESQYFKAIVSGDPIDAEHKFRKPYSFKPYARLVFSANKMPSTYDRSDAFFRRWLIVPFDKVIADDEIDPNMIDKLRTEQNLQAWLYLCVEHLRELDKRGYFKPNEALENALETYRERNDLIGAFLRRPEIAGYTITDVPDEKGFIRAPVRVLWSAFKQWCELEDEEVKISRRRFLDDIMDRFPKAVKKEARVAQFDNEPVTCICDAFRILQIEKKEENQANMW